MKVYKNIYKPPHDYGNWALNVAALKEVMQFMFLLCRKRKYESINYLLVNVTGNLCVHVFKNVSMSLRS